MSYDYNRTAGLKQTAWGDAMMEWIKNATGELANSIARGMGKYAEKPKVQQLHGFGWMAAIKAYDKADLEFDIHVSVTWVNNQVELWAYTSNHPMRNTVKIVQESLAWGDPAKGTIQDAGSTAKKLFTT